MNTAAFTITIAIANAINPNSLRPSSYLTTPKISTYYSGNIANNYLVETTDSTATVWQ